MAMLGFSLNNLSLFGLVLAIGIVVDDAIVVVENVERYLSMGYGAARGGPAGDGRVSGPVIAIALVLCAVFVPTAFMAGHQRGVLQAVRPDDRRLDDHLGVQLADAQPGPVRDSAEPHEPAARRKPAALECLIAASGLFLAPSRSLHRAGHGGKAAARRHQGSAGRAWLHAVVCRRSTASWSLLRRLQLVFDAITAGTAASSPAVCGSAPSCCWSTAA